MPRVLVMYGPNLNLLGMRDPQHYGELSLDAINERVAEAAQRLGLEVEFFQSNHEGALIDRLHATRAAYDAVVLNPGGLGHTSVALRDAVAAIDVPVVECHLSNVARRAPFRRRSLLTAVCAGVVAGFGPATMVLGVHAAALLLQARRQEGR